MRVGINCMKCLLDRQYRRVSAENDPEKAALYMKDVCNIIGTADPEWPSPVLTPMFNDAFDKYFGHSDRFAEIKLRSNEYLLERIDSIRERIETSDDPLLLALKLARVGNYIDFGALGNTVAMEKLDELLASAADEQMDMTEYHQMLTELSNANALLYLADNAGELVLDKLLIEQLIKSFPKLNITLAVRGYPILNDATTEDAGQVGIDKLVEVIDNGSHIAGTYIPDISDKMHDRLNSADVILAKGQGNFETLSGCGLNVYYAFLCKCQLFCGIFNVPMLTGMFLNEKRTNVRN